VCSRQRPQRQVSAIAELLVTLCARTGQADRHTYGVQFVFGPPIETGTIKFVCGLQTLVTWTFPGEVDLWQIKPSTGRACMRPTKLKISTAVGRCRHMLVSVICARFTRGKATLTTVHGVLPTAQSHYATSVLSAETVTIYARSAV